MNDYNYIVGVDENGQPYIEHAGSLRSAASNAIGGVKSGANRGGKYIMKVATTYGNRYFYTPQEVAAYQNAKTKVNPANSRPTVERITKAAPAVLKNASNKAGSSVKAYKDYQNKVSAETRSKLKKHPVAMKAEIARRKVAESGETIEIASNKAKEKASEVGSNLKSKSDRMREEFRKKVEDKVGITARKDLEKAKRGNDAAAALYERVDKAEKDHYINGDSKLNALRNLNEHEYNEFHTKNVYDRTPLGKAEKALNRLKGKDEEKRGYGEGSHSELAKKANADYEREELEIAAKRGPIDTKNASKEYIYSLGSNSGHAGEVSKTMKKEEAYKKAKRVYDRLNNSSNANAADVAAARQQMNKLENEYNDSLDELVKALNDNAEDAKKEIKRKIIIPRR